MSSDSPADLDNFCELVAMLLSQDRRGALQAVKFPADAPHSIILYLRDLTPPVHVYSNAQGSVLVVDGEIYRADYRARGPAAPVDLEDLLARLSADPEGALDGLDAAAFITFFNAQDDSVYVARDAIGNVPGYYRTDPRRLIWSSDLATLMALDPDWEFNDACVDFFLAAGYAPAPWTFVRDIWKIEPGHVVMRSRGKNAVPVRYINYRVPPREALPESQVVARLKDLFPIAVSRRATSAQHTGVLLSGGVDSKAILGTMATYLDMVPKTFTFLYQGYEGALNEGGLARECAEHFGAEHHEIAVDPSLFPTLVPDLLTDFGEPFSYGLHTVMLDQVREHGIRDLLCGTGADGAWFLGAQQIGAMKFLSLPQPVRTLVGTGVNAAQSALNAAKSAGYFLDRPSVKFHHSVWSARTQFPAVLSDAITPYHFRRRLHADKTLAERAQKAVYAVFEQALADVEGLDLHQKYRVLQTRFYGADMMQNWNHWSGRGRGLSIRAPYYDREAWDFMLSQPFMRNDKIELREFASTMMPREMAYAPKLPQSVPILPWMQGPFKEWILDTLTLQRLARSGRFDPQAVQNLLGDFYAGRPLPRRAPWTIWNILMVTLWHERKRLDMSAVHSG